MSHPADLRQSAEALASALPPLMVAAEALARSALQGGHGRRQTGAGAEFWQFRPAHPGDSATRIDWRRSGRGDDLFVRETEWQAARSVMLWVDPGAAMRFTGDRRRATKAERARLLALALGLLLLRGGERVGLAGTGLAPRAGKAQGGFLAGRLAGDPGAEAEHAPPDLGAAPFGGHAVLFSDFLGDLAPLDAALAMAGPRAMQGLLVQVLDPVEEDFPFDGRTRFESMSGHLSHETLQASDLREAYRKRLATRKDDLAQRARKAGWRHVTLHTDRPAAEGLIWLHQSLGGFR